MSSPVVSMTLDEAVEEVLLILTGLGLAYDPSYDRYRVIAKMLNRALRANALEHEWSWYNGTVSAGTSTEGQTAVSLAAGVRPRMTGDDAVRLVELAEDEDDSDSVVVWAYFLPRDALHKYGYRQGLWVSSVRDLLMFSRPLQAGEAGLDIQIPVQREPAMFDIPAHPEDPETELTEIDPETRTQLVDFQYPDVIVARAAYLYAQTDPVMQPRAQTLEGGYKDLMYQVIERDDRHTDAPYQNEFYVPVQNTIYAEPTYAPHPLADERRS